MGPRIIVHSDFSDGSVTAVRYARILAHELGGSLQFLHVVREPLSAGWTAEVRAATLPEVQQAMEVEAEQWLDRMLSEEEQERLGATLDVETGDIAEEIVRYASEQHADIVLLSASRDNAADNPDVVTTAIAEKVVRKCHCSVFVVRA